MTHTSRIIAGQACCQDCGKYKELRPYGKNGAWVCFKCAMKDEAEAQRQFNKASGTDVTIIDVSMGDTHGAG